jgi:tRNA pseudouridine55 synthase
VLAESVGENLGVPAHLASLRRTRAGHFKIEDATRLDKLKEMAAEDAAAGELLLPPDAALSELPFVHLTAEEARAARHGRAVHLNVAAEKKYTDGQYVRMRDQGGNLLAVGCYDARTGGLHPRTVLSPEK